MQRLAWAIGRPFCKFPSEDLEKRLKAQEERLFVMQTRESECDRRYTDLEHRYADMIGRFETMRTDYFKLIAHVSKPAEPSTLHLLEEDA